MFVFINVKTDEPIGTMCMYDLKRNSFKMKMRKRKHHLKVQIITRKKEAKRPVQRKFVNSLKKSTFN